MGSLKQPFKFDISGLLARFRALPIDADATVTISLPGISVSARIDDSERRVARELVIRLADRRVLNARECCDDCIAHSLASLQEIRQLVVDKQVELQGRANSKLYLLLELLAAGIRQFLTYEESIRRDGPALPVSALREQYFAGLEALRGHIYRTMVQVASVADVEIPGIADAMTYSPTWNLDAYITDQRPLPLE